MEEKLTKAFDSLHMGEECSEKILFAMKAKKKPHFFTVRHLRTASAVFVLLLLISGLHPAVGNAVGDFTQAIQTFFAWKPDSPDSAYSTDDTEPDNHTTGPVWLKERNGRVYFLANMENRDITESFSADTPFTYHYEKDGVLHYIAIGGLYDPVIGLKSIGYAEWLRDSDKMNEGVAEGKLHAGWISGDSSFQYLDPDGLQYPVWYARAVVEMEIPWGYTEAKQQLDALDETK